MDKEDVGHLIIIVCNSAIRRDELRTGAESPHRHAHRRLSTVLGELMSQKPGRGETE